MLAIARKRRIFQQVETIGDCAEKDPSETWYQGDLRFYEFYINPLVMKLKDYGVK
jgi:hypothetical protein